MPKARAGQSGKRREERDRNRAAHLEDIAANHPAPRTGPGDSPTVDEPGNRSDPEPTASSPVPAPPTAVGRAPANGDELPFAPVPSSPPRAGPETPAGSPAPPPSASAPGAGTDRLPVDPDQAADPVSIPLTSETSSSSPPEESAVIPPHGHRVDPSNAEGSSVDEEPVLDRNGDERMVGETQPDAKPASDQPGRDASVPSAGHDLAVSRVQRATEATRSSRHDGPVASAGPDRSAVNLVEEPEDLAVTGAAADLDATTVESLPDSDVDKTTATVDDVGDHVENAEASPAHVTDSVEGGAQMDPPRAESAEADTHAEEDVTAQDNRDLDGVTPADDQWRSRAAVDDDQPLAGQAADDVRFETGATTGDTGPSATGLADSGESGASHAEEASADATGDRRAGLLDRVGSAAEAARATAGTVAGRAGQTAQTVSTSIAETASGVADTIRGGLREAGGQPPPDDQAPEPGFAGRGAGAPVDARASRQGTYNRLVVATLALGTVSGLNRWAIRRLTGADIAVLGPAAIRPMILGTGMAALIASVYLAEE